jgi:autotransporter-associated beta strand protein
MITNFINSLNINKTLTEILTGGGHLTWASPAKTLIINTAQTYSGRTTSANTATISIGNGGTTGSVAGDIVSNSTINFNRSDNQTIPNILGGTGNFTKNTNTTMILTGENTCSGTFTNGAGTLQLGNGGTTGTIGTANVVNNGSMISNRTTNFTIAGIISGTGNFTKQNTNITILANNNSYTGLTTISTGTLQVGNGGATGSISGAITNNANLVFNRTGSYGSAIPTGAGTTRVVNGTYGLGSVGDLFLNAMTGTMTVEAGATYSTGANGILEMGNSAFFINGNGTIVFRSFFRMVFNGNFTFNSVGGGTFRREASSGSANFRPNVMNFTTNGGAKCNWIINDAPANQAINHTFNISLGSDAISDFLISGNNVMNAGNIIKNGLGRLQVTNPNTSGGTTTVNAGTFIISNTTGINTGATTVNSGGTLTYTVNTTGTRTVTVNAGGVVNRGGFAHTGTTFINNGGIINI